MQNGIAAWPGDEPYRYELSWRMSEGAAVNVGAVTMSVHSGTHADAPFHFDESGATIDRLDPSAFFGPATVIDVTGRDSIAVGDLESIDLSETPRVLLKTGAWTDHARFPESIPVLEGDVPGYLHDRGVILVGLDVPSVDALDSKDLPIHHGLGRRGIHILESLNLAAVPAGRYDLIALPLRLVGADGAPVRAVLRQVGGRP